jgi:hypothetical protein
MPRYKLRTLMILLAMGPPVLALVIVSPAAAALAAMPVAAVLWDYVWS